MTQRRPVYLDHHATTPVDPRVREAMLPWFTDRFGNASSVHHAFGAEARAAVERAREQVAGLVGTSPESIVFTSGATEANNLAIKGIVEAASGSTHIVTNAAEHRAVLDPIRRLERRGTRATVLPVDEFARVTAESVRDAIRDDTRIVGVMWANNEVGTINPIAEIANVCREHGVFLHCDAAQAVGRLPVDVARIGVDLLSISAHKLYGPQGIGALIVRRGSPRVRLAPQLEGGGHERNLRSGTLAVPLIVGFGAAAALANEQMADDAERLRALRDRLERGLRVRVPDLVTNGDPHDRLPGNLNLSVPDVDGDALLAAITEVALSSGAACSTAEPAPSHVLLAMGRSESLTRAGLRFGIGRFNTVEEIDFAVEHVARAIDRVREAGRSRSKRT